jgi:hypothetical protein
MVGRLIKKEVRMKDFESQIINRGEGTTTYVANFFIQEWYDVY